MRNSSVFTRFGFRRHYKNLFIQIPRILHGLKRLPVVLEVVENMLQVAPNIQIVAARNFVAPHIVVVVPQARSFEDIVERNFVAVTQELQALEVR